MNETMRKVTKTDVLTDSLLQDIINNVFSPGERLPLSLLKERYKTGATPIREALSRLSAKGLVEIEPQCGCHVPTLSVEELRDIYRIREAITVLAIELIVEHSDEAWEAELMASWHKLSKYLTTQQTVETQEWEKRQKDFFHTLMKGSKSPWLIKIHDLLYDQATRYRLLCINKNHRNKTNLARYIAEDQSLVDALLAKNKIKAKKIFAQIWQNTVEQIENILSKQLLESN